MSARRTGGAGRDRTPDPEEVLAGRIVLGAFELVRLIHRVSPTAENLPAEERTRRYALKARLQSLLIRRFGPSLRVEAQDPSHPEIVSLKLRNFDDDACHAVLSQLDDDARSWAQWQIDQAPDPAGGPEGTRGARHRGAASRAAGAAADEAAPVGADEWLARARRALEEYDYEACDDCLTRAFSLSQGATEAAAALLEFLVDSLAAYDRAVAVGENLGRSARQDPAVRTLLALAQVHSGRLADALEEVRRVHHPRVAEVCLAGAKRCVREGDLERAEAFVSLLRVRETGDRGQELVAVEADLARLKARGLQPLEEEMLRLWEENASEEATALARRLLAESPENRTARRLLREAERRERDAEIDRLLGEADRARARSDAAGEASWLRRACSLGAEREGLRERAARAEEAAQRERTEAEVRKTVDLWRGGKEKEALLGFAALPPEARPLAAERCGAPVFSWIEQLASSAAAPRPEKTVEAALLLRSALEQLESGGDPGRAAELLRAHEKLLRPLALARETLRRAEALARERERERARGLLREAECLVEAEALAPARRCIDRVRAALLDAEEAADLQALDARLKRLERLRVLEGRYASALEGDDAFGARRLARELAEVSGSGHWARRAAELSAEVREQWRLAAFDLLGVPKARAAAGLDAASGRSSWALLEDGRRAVCAAAHGRWGFLRVYDLETQAFARGVLFRAPADLGLPEITLSGAELWLAGGDAGAVAALALEPLDVLHWDVYGDLLAEDRIVERSLLFPNSRAVWLESREREGFGVADAIEIVDLDQHRSERRLKVAGSLAMPFQCRGEFQVANRRLESQAVQIYSEQGKLLKVLSPEGSADEVALHPNGTDYVLLSYDADPPSEDEAFGEASFVLRLEVRPDEAGRFEPIRFDGSNGELVHGLVTSHESGLVFAHWREAEPSEFPCRLAAFRPGERGFEELYRKELRGDPLLVPDPTSGRVAAVDLQGPDTRAELLGAREPALFVGAERRPQWSDFPDFGAFMTCATAPGERARANAAWARVAGSPPSELAEAVEGAKRSAAEDPSGVVALAVALERLDAGRAKDLRDWMRAEYRVHPRVAVAAASEAVKRRDWDEIARMLDGGECQGLDEEMEQHRCHLLGMALFARGDVERASSLWEDALERTEGNCGLEALSEYARISLLSPAEREEERSDVARMLVLLERADRHLSRGEWEAAAQLLEGGAGLGPGRQVLARLAHAYLQQDVPASDPIRFLKTLALAEYCALEDLLLRATVFPPFVETWSEARLAEVAERAARWLEEEG